MKTDKVTDRELAMLIVPGLILTIGCVWYMSGFAVAGLILGLLLLIAGWSCVRADD